MNLEDRIKAIGKKTLNLGLDFLAVEIAIGLPIDTIDYKLLNIGRPLYRLIHDSIHWAVANSTQPIEIDPDSMGYVGEIAAKFPQMYKLSPDLYERTGFDILTHFSPDTSNTLATTISPLVTLPLLGYLLFENRHRLPKPFFRTLATASGLYLMAEPILNVFSNMNYKATDFYQVIHEVAPNYDPTMNETLGIALLTSIAIFGACKLGEKVIKNLYINKTNPMYDRTSS